MTFQQQAVMRVVLLLRFHKSIIDYKYNHKYHIDYIHCHILYILYTLYGYMLFTIFSAKADSPLFRRSIQG